MSEFTWCVSCLCVVEALDRDGFVVFPEDTISVEWIKEARDAVKAIGAKSRFGGLRIEYNFALDHKPFDSPGLICIYNNIHM